MAEGSVDRRVVRTQRKLHKALVSLIHAKDYQAITVEDICAAAGVGRSTFYAHYSGKDDLKRKGLEQLRKQLLAQQRTSSKEVLSEAPRFSLPMFEHAREHIDHYRALSGNRGGAWVPGIIRQILSELLYCELAATEHMDSGDFPPRELVVEYVIGAYMAILVWWLDGGAKLPPQQVDVMFRRLTTAALSAYRH
ncbi:TetR/AcrR family transcriptional regulator [Bradyrhizobium centrolobii]|uniref:TetR/AcrR family transcriptional regulator n=1 Tax=Bradyrhizobium centrolobii TaxID=1505087 RepID=UPI0009ED8EEC|nr:TetR/AcrR family transcriptional regulator [Bradyrhizobium centrolobii]